MYYGVREHGMAAAMNGMACTEASFRIPALFLSFPTTCARHCGWPP